MSSTMKSFRSAFFSLSLVAALALTGPAASATNSTDSNESSPTISASIDPESTEMPYELNQFVGELMESIPDSSYTWNGETQKVSGYAFSDLDARRLSLIVSGSKYRSYFTLERSDHSFLELEELSRKVVEEGLDGIPVYWAGPSPDGSEIQLGLQSSKGSVERFSTGRGVKLAGVPVSITLEDDQPSTSATRQNDSYGNQRHGGALMNRPSPTTAAPNQIIICSTAFALRNSVGGSPAMLTADHCGGSNTVWRVGLSTSSAFGTMKPISNDGTDIKIVQDSSLDYRGYVYWGAYTSDAVVKVSGYKVPVVGDVVCFSGSRSGTVCGGATITQVNLTVSYSSGLVYSKLFKAYLQNTVGLAGPGDSGGPVISINSDGTSVSAVGVISGIQNPGSATCLGIQERECSNVAFVAPVSSYFAKYPNSYLP